MYSKNFIQACIDADVLVDQIDDYIDEWHDGDYDVEIYEFLGMTQEEYRLWVENDSMIKYIIIAHMENKSIEEVISELYESEKLVARAKSADEAKTIHDWLKRKNKI